MLKTIISLISISLLTINATSIAQPSITEPNAIKEEPLDRIAVVINNEIITQSVFNHYLALAKQQFTQRHIPIPDERVFKKQVIDQLIYQKLQLQLAKQNKLVSNNEEINAAIARIATQNQISQSALKKKLIQQGISYLEFRKQIQQQLLISKLEQQIIANNIAISKSDVICFRKQHQAQITSTRYHVATILIPMSKDTPKSQINHIKFKALLVLKQLRKGLSFEHAMVSHPGSSDLGWRSISDIPQVFVSSISKMKPNEIMGPIQAHNGFHIIKLLGKKTQELSDNRQIQQIVYRQKFERALQQWLGQLRRSSYVRICIDL